MDVAAGRPGDHPVSADDREALPEEPTIPTRSRAGHNAVLAIVVVLLLALGVVGGVLVRQTHDDRALDASEQERYGDVLSAARSEAEAFINIRYDDARSSIDKVASGATGDFRRQYDTSTKGVIQALRRNRSVMDGKVVWAGIVDADPDSATVIAATSGTVSNVSTHNKPVARSFRLKLDLARVGDRWLTSNLEFVG